MVKYHIPLNWNSENLYIYIFYIYIYIHTFPISGILSLVFFLFRDCFFRFEKIMLFILKFEIVDLKMFQS